MGRSMRYEDWMQRLLLTNEEVGVSQYVLEAFIQAWDERMVVPDERELLDVKHAG